MSGYFVTGTDTGVGKTTISLALMCMLKSRGLSVAGMKPVAAGAIRMNGQLCNDDALQLQNASSAALIYEQVNPYAYTLPASPHIAAGRDGCPVDFRIIIERLRELESLADLVVVEGLGGWEVPLDESRRLSDLAAEIALPVILVVGLRLGCLNHAYLTHDAIVRRGLECAGWIANQVDPGFAFVEENIDRLRRDLFAKYLGCLPYSKAPGDLALCTADSSGNTLDIDEFLRRFNG